MKTTICIFITAITVTLAGSAIAENSLAPGGPYRSINEDNKSALYDNSIASSQPGHRNKYDASQTQQLNRNFQNPNAAEAPEWVKKRQAEMQNFMKQHNSRMQAERQSLKFQQPEVPQWVKQRQAQMEQQLKQSNRLPPQGWNNQPPPQWNQNQLPPVRHPASGQFAPNNKMYSASPRGPVFRPGVAPPGFNNQPGNSRSYPPAWR